MLLAACAAVPTQADTEYRDALRMCSRLPGVLMHLCMVKAQAVRESK